MKRQDRIEKMKASQARKADSRVQDGPPAASEPTERPNGQTTVQTPRRAANGEPWRWPDGTHIEKDWVGGKWLVIAWVPGATRQFRAQGTSSKEAEGEVRKEFVKWLAEQKKIESEAGNG